MKAGEFILGYVDEIGELVPLPKPAATFGGRRENTMQPSCHYGTDSAGKIIAGRGSLVDGIWTEPCTCCASQAKAWFAQETVLRNKPKQV